MNKLFIGFTFFCFSFCTIDAWSQVVIRDTVFLASSIKNTKTRYDQSVGGQSHLYNGLAYKGYRNDFTGSPFFAQDWEDGSVRYDNELYENVPMLYDLITDKIIISHYYSHAEMELISKKVDWFSIHGHTFIHLRSDLPATDIQDGFYDLMVDGNVKFFVRRQKQIEERIVLNKLLLEIESHDRYFIFKDGRYIPVKKKSSVWTALGDRKKELQAYSKKNKLDFRRKPEAALIALVKYYDPTAR